MQEKLWEKFKKTGKVEDYLRYREEISKELFHGEENEKRGNSIKGDKLPRNK